MSYGDTDATQRVRAWLSAHPDVHEECLMDAWQSDGEEDGREGLEIRMANDIRQRMMGEVEWDVLAEEYLAASRARSPTRLEEGAGFGQTTSLIAPTGTALTYSLADHTK